jgi:hypothetical protein
MHRWSNILGNDSIQILHVWVMFGSACRNSSNLSPTMSCSCLLSKFIDNFQMNLSLWWIHFACIKCAIIMTNSITCKFPLTASQKSEFGDKLVELSINSPSILALVWSSNPCFIPNLSVSLKWAKLGTGSWN